ncbi:MAG: 4-(cytidine 5'-diphospho)-2-C-methyl-D-erythritol kinase [Nitrosomonas sp.]|nr:4-(cytidine 5'-diphospho)-2-C-methyl-D-erythritol kinase [Nitrosomonas sp.]MDL1865404.1 4-(cytidine 5'-diphospho)-2-C-methyl-D-erythritol kinase [Betaproteobacteria bacterium PRO5]
MDIFPAPAKLNLFLHVIGRREDGYHLLQTVFRFIDYSDRLHFDITHDGVIRHENLIPGLMETDDLCVRAAKLLRQWSGKESLGVKIRLEKNIPLGGGLGGGSSDAATTLIALNRLWGINWKREHLMALGLELGADVPVFIYGRNAFAEGVGEELHAVDLPSAWYVVLTPPVQISTAAVFTSKELTRNTIPIKMAAFSMGQGHNDLEPVAMRMQPVIAEWLGWLKQQHGTTKVAMSGSGSCVFAEFPSESAAREVFGRLPGDMNGFVVSGLARHPLSDF